MKVIEIQKHKSLSEVVYEQLKQQILEGNIAPGTRMMEVELSEKMGVSRTPIREAIRMLEKEGLVEVRPRHGAYSSQVSIQEILGILEVRQNMDGMAAALATERGTKKDFERIQEMAKAYEDSVKTGDLNEIIKCDEKFHESIADAGHNATLVKIVSDLQNLVIRFRYIYYNNPEIISNLIAEHKEILDAIRGGDVEKARKVAGGHIDSLSEFIKGYKQGDEKDE